jgi:hypothetical protein
MVDAWTDEFSLGVQDQEAFHNSLLGSKTELNMHAVTLCSFLQIPARPFVCNAPRISIAKSMTNAYLRMWLLFIETKVATRDIAWRYLLHIMISNIHVAHAIRNDGCVALSLFCHDMINFIMFHTVGRIDNLYYEVDSKNILSG